MKFLLLYKGNYGKTLRGPELRYVALAKELTQLNQTVTLCGHSATPDSIPKNVEFIPLSQRWLLTKVFFQSDAIVLHGGGPLILLLALLSGLLGRRLIMDSYVPHWIELDQIARTAPESKTKLILKSYFNVGRALLGTLAFNLNIVANKRQMDILRGMSAPFSLTNNFPRITIIPFGCERAQYHPPEKGRERLSALSGTTLHADDFLIGWLGGTYGWFDLEHVLREASKAMIRNPSIKLFFFGTPNDQKIEVLKYTPTSARNNIYFLPWIDYANRFDYWSGFDISLVWGANSYENDYASRTRNFDCLTLNLPIVQNDDDEWAPRLLQAGAGIVADRTTLCDELVELSKNPKRVNEMRQAMASISSDYYWSHFAATLLDNTLKQPMSVPRRAVGIIAFTITLPSLVISMLYNISSAIRKKRKSKSGSK